MTQYREILRLSSQGISKASIAVSCACSRNTVASVINRAEVQGMYYSVPYEYIKQKVEVRLTKGAVEVFFQGNRITSHVRRHGKPGQYSTVPEHMPEDHRKYTQWNAERFIAWAQGIGEHTTTVVKAILASRQVEQQSYRACMALLKLADKHGTARLESACKRALSYTPSPSFKSIQTILQTGQDRLPDEPPAPEPSSEFGFIRGADYYGRKKQ